MLRSTPPILVLLALGSALPLPAQRGPTAPPANRVLWTVETQAPSYGSAAAADLDGDGHVEVVFGTYFNDEHAYCLDGRSGKLRWKKRSRGGPLDASVLIADLVGDRRPETVFADSARGRLWCLAANGEEIWHFDGPSGTDSPPALGDLDGDGKLELVYGTMKVRGGDGRVVALEAASGKVRWTAVVPGHVQSEPALADLNGDGKLDVLVTTWRGDDRLRALDGSNGQELWHFETGDWIYHGVSVADLDRDQRPEVIVADRKGTVWMLQGETGREVWSRQLEGESRGTVFGPTSLVDADGKGALEIAVPGRHLHLLDAKGRVRWRQTYGGRSIARGCAVADIDGDGGQDLVFGEGTRLRALRARDRKELWSYELRSGEHRWERIDHAPLLLDLDGDGRLDVFVVVGKGTSDASRPQNYGRAWALRAGRGKATARNRWMTFRGGNRRLGRPEAPASRDR
jgi:outer membrane protein assembly factor BamB